MDNQLSEAQVARSRARRSALIVAATVEVLCPHCQEPQPNPDNGAFPWTPEEVRQQAGKRICVSCEEPFVIRAMNRADVL